MGVQNCTTVRCEASRGPTDCTHGECQCKKGFCRYPQGIAGIALEKLKCYARIPGSSCHFTRTCWSGGGFTKSFCGNGYCMCNSVGDIAKPVKKDDTSAGYVCTPLADQMTELDDENQ